MALCNFIKYSFNKKFERSDAARGGKMENEKSAHKTVQGGV